MAKAAAQPAPQLVSVYLLTDYWGENESRYSAVKDPKNPVPEEAVDIPGDHAQRMIANQQALPVSLMPAQSQGLALGREE